MGADAVYGLTELPDDRRDAIRAATGGHGPDIVIEAAGSARAVEEGLEIVRDGGVYVIAGHYTDVGASTISAHRHINRKHLDVRGCWGSEVRHFAAALDLLARHSATVPWARIGETAFGLGELTEALRQAEALAFTKALVAPNGVPPAA
jgi:L-iditol 2-dehydrogenase